MNKKKNWISFLFSALVLLGSAMGAHAQTTSPNNPKIVCDVNQNTLIDLGTDVLGQLLTLEGGDWYQISSGTAPTGAPTSDMVKVSNVQATASWLPGEYYFAYYATSNACMTENTWSDVAVIRILKTATDFSHAVYACDGDDVSLDLNNILPAGLVGVEYVSTSVSSISISGSSLGIGTSYSGLVTVVYKANVGSGACESEAEILIDVMRDGLVEPSFMNDMLNLCQDDFATINLQHEAGATALTSGTWSITSGTASVVAATGVATLPSTDGKLDVGTYVFEYEWTRNTGDCFESGSLNFTVVVTADNTSLGSGHTDDICKTGAPNQLYDLLGGIGLNVPANAGYWEVVDKPLAQVSEIDLSQGKFDISNAASGVYEFKYTLSDVNNTCFATGSTDLTVTVGDIGASAVYDGRVQLCATDLTDGVAPYTGDFVLGDYVMGIDAVTVTGWTTTTGLTITNGAIAYADLKTLNVGTYRFSFDFKSAGCGDAVGTGDLYVTITNNVDISEEIVLSFCRPDMPREINLAQVVGTVLDGSWAWDGAAPAATEATLANGVFSEALEQAGEGAKTYVMVFTPTSGIGCSSASSIKVTIKVDDDDFN